MGHPTGIQGYVYLHFQTLCLDARIALKHFRYLFKMSLSTKRCR